LYKYRAGSEGLINVGAVNFSLLNKTSVEQFLPDNFVIVCVTVVTLLQQ
jgi:hypothetical protein